MAYAKTTDEAILSSIGDGLVVVDKEGKIIRINNAFENLVGWTQKEVFGKLLVEVVPREDESGNIVPFNERILTKVLSTTTTWYYIRKDKTKFPATSIITPFILKGEIVGAIEVFRDITKEKAVEKDLEKFKLAVDNKANLSVDQKEYVNEAAQASHRMVGLVDSLLNVSRIEMGTFMIAPRLNDVSAIIKTCVKQFEHKILEKKLKINEYYDPLVPKIMVDDKLLNIVCQNLLENAVNYTPEAGKIKVSLAKKESDILISIADTGIGIPKGQQAKIFTKMFRADNAREKEANGNGLGLYMTKAIVDHSGGKVWFESVEGKGTIFFVTLPLSGMRPKEGTKNLT